jgi:hypothetical protein
VRVALCLAADGSMIGNQIGMVDAGAIPNPKEAPRSQMTVVWRTGRPSRCADRRWLPDIGTKTREPACRSAALRSDQGACEGARDDRDLGRTFAGKTVRRRGPDSGGGRPRLPKLERKDVERRRPGAAVADDRTSHQRGISVVGGEMQPVAHHPAPAIRRPQPVFRWRDGRLASLSAGFAFESPFPDRDPRR